MNPLTEDPLRPWLTPPKTEWRGNWIWTAEPPPYRNAYSYFRRTFATTGGTLNIDITADSFYWLFLDGELIAHGPARAHLEYYTFDTHRLAVAPGRHCLAILGHHIGEVNATVMTGRAGVLAEVMLVEAVRQQDLSTGPDWQCRSASGWRRDLPCLMSHFGFWEDCDLRELPQHWTLPDFDAAGWMPPAVIGTPPCAPWIRLCPGDILPPRSAALAPVCYVGAGRWQGGAEDPIPAKVVAARRREPAPAPAGLPLRFDLGEGAGGRYLTADFGRTVSGYVVVEFANSAPGQCVEFSYDDLVNADGIVNPERSYAHLTDRFILPGGRCRIRTLHPRGFRYLMLDVSGAGPLELQSLGAADETYPFDLQPAFTGPDSALNDYYRKSAETVRICTTDAFTDCATRERVQWMEDLYLHSRVAAYAFGDTRMLRRALFQAAQNALPDGRINGFFPSERTNCAFASSSILWLHLLVDYWLFAGNDDITRLLPAARRTLALIESLCSAEGLVASWPAGQFWDWSPIEETGCLLLTNAAYAWALQRLGRHDIFCEVLGVDLEVRAATIRTAAHARFWDEARGLYRDAVPAAGLTPIYSQHANSLAALAGVCPRETQAELLKRIIDPDRLGPVPVGEQSLGKGARPAPDRIVPVGTLWFGHFLCQALFEAGLDCAALEQMRKLWGAFADLPTFPETRIQSGNTFLCHGWAAGPAYLLPAYVLGVQPVGPGWSAVVVEPHPGGLEEARGQLSTAGGSLAVAWRRKDKKYAIDVTPQARVRVNVIQPRKDG